MALRKTIEDREWDCFTTWDTGETAKRVQTKGNLDVKPTGLNIAGRISIVTIDDSSWTKIPNANLADRNAIHIQNQSSVDLKYNYDNTVIGYVGILVPSGGSLYMDITDDIDIYAKSASGSVEIAVEEIS